MNESEITYATLNPEQIFIELVKRFSKMKKREGSTISEIFGDGWDALDKVSRSIAEKKFRKKIHDHEIHGIRCDESDEGLYSLERYSADEIFYEIIKRFPLLPQGSEVCLRELFGEEWFLLGRKNREAAEERFVDGIRDLDIKGIKYVLNKTNYELFRNEDNEILYTRIANDNYC
jgi:hypothetical protein